MRSQWILTTTALAVCLAASATVARAVPSAAQPSNTAITHVAITHAVIEPSATRPGINLGQQNFYDSGQMLRNLVSRNPGFEGMTYRSVVHCDPAHDPCTETTGGIQWPAGFWDGGSFEVLVRHLPASTDVYRSADAHGRIGQSMPTDGGYRIQPVHDGQTPEPGDWLRLSKDFPGDPTAGWWTHVHGGARLTAERSDLSPHTLGHQALRVEAASPGQSAQVTSYFDSTDGRRFLRFHGEYILHFRAKPLVGAAQLQLQVGRSGQPDFFHRSIPLKAGWQDYQFRFPAEDSPQADAAQSATASLSFTIASASLLLDDVSLEAAADPAAQNPTAFRDEVVATLRALHPGLIRLMASQQLGASMRDLLAPPLARQRAGYSVWSQREEDVAIGIPEFLALCRAVGAEPWIVLPLAIDTQEAKLLAEYLTDDATTPGGAIRASEGQSQPWTQLFPRIHLELGNEAWNSIFHGASMEDPGAYGEHARQVFSALRAQPGTASLDLVVNAQAGTQRLPEQQDALTLQSSEFADTLAIAPYMMHTVDHAASDAELFAPLLAEPEYFAALLRQARQAAASKQLAVYEVNLHSTEGAADQAALDRLTPSLAAGLAVTDLILRMKRDDRVRNAMVFSLPQYEFRRSDGKHVRLWGTVVDMGPTMRRRPLFVAEAMLNAAIHGDMVRVATTGADPTHPVPRGNDGVALSAAHDLDFFAFQTPPSPHDPHGSHFHHVLIAYNLSLTSAHTVQVDGLAASQILHWSRLGDGNPAASNENSQQVKPQTGTNSGGNFDLPPSSMTVVEWDQ